MTNCFLIADETAKKAVLFDAPDHTVEPLLDAVIQRLGECSVDRNSPDGAVAGDSDGDAGGGAVAMGRGGHRHRAVTR